MKISDVKCYYTGGGVYIYSAKYGDSAFLYGSFDQYISCYSARGEILQHDEDVCQYYGWTDEMNKCSLSLDEAYIPPEKIEYPTWLQILDSLSSAIKHDPGIGSTLVRYNPNLHLRTCDNYKPTEEEDSRPIGLIVDILEAFESFLEEKGIDVPNTEKDDDPEASTIYGSDYGNLCDEIEAILKSYGIDKNSVS